MAISVEKKFHQIGEHLINSAGVPGFKWTQFDPITRVGHRTHVAAQTLSSNPFEFNCEGVFTCEQTETSSTLGLNFILPPKEAEILDTIAAKEGALPDFVRKFPRINYLQRVPIFPARVILRFFNDGEDIMVSCDVENVSPSGLSVFSEDRRLEHMKPGEVVRVQIQPRGDFKGAINMNASVKRIVHTVDPLTSNARKFLGLAITTISNEHKVLFTDLLRMIVGFMRG